MYELNKQNYSSIAKMLHEADYLQVFAYSVMEHKQPGRIFVDNLIQPGSCFVISESGRYLVAGDSGNYSFIHSVIEYLTDNKNHGIYYDLYAANIQWLDAVVPSLGDRVIRLKRSSYVYHVGEENRVNNAANYISLEPMDEGLFIKYRDELDGSYSSLWGSPENFTSHGFGYCVVINNKIVSACNTFYIGERYAEIDIVTEQEYRNRGYAQATCRSFIEKCRERGLIPVWDCDAGNDASNQLALKLGFEKRGTYEMLWWHEDKNVIQSYMRNYGYIHP